MKIPKSLYLGVCCDRHYPGVRCCAGNRGGAGGHGGQHRGDDIGGVVRGPNGPEAGVWVIAETTDLPTKMNKTVVTDDQGRYLIPESAQGQLHRVGTRLWSRRFGQDDDRTRQDRQPHRGARSQ